MNNQNTSYNYSIRLLSKRDYSKFKLTQKLKMRGHSQEEINQTIEKLIEQNYLREDEYKRMRIKQLLNKGYAPNYIIQKCEQENLEVSDEDIYVVMQTSLITNDDQLDKLIQKKIRYLKIPDNYNEKQKIKNNVFRFLLGKGYKYDQFKELVEKYF